MNILASEWIKTRSLRSTWIIAAATVVVTVLVSLLGISAQLGDWHVRLPADFDPAGNSFKGILVGQILIATLGAQMITSEYANGQIATSLATVPRRGALLAAKAAITLLIGGCTAIVTVTCSFAASQAALATAGLPTADLAEPDVIRAILCAVVYLVLTAVLGLAFGTISQSSSSALAIIVTVALLVPALAPGLPGLIGDFAGTYWPTTAGQISYTVSAGAPLPPLVGIGVLAIFTLWCFVAANLALKVRDA